MISRVSENGAAGPSPEFQTLLSVLGDPHRAEVARMWEGVVQSQLGPEERAKAERMAPVIRRYLSREIEREQYDTEMAALSVPTL